LGGEARLLGQSIVEQDRELLGFQWMERRVLIFGPPANATLRKPADEARKRQNTYSVTQLAAEEATIVDPTHPLFGQTLPILRASRHHLKNLIVLALPDGRERRIPVSITNLVELPPANTKSAGLISVRTLMPLVELIRAMVAPQEDNIHGTAPHSTAAGESPQCDQLSGTGSSLNDTALEQFGSEHSESIDPVSSRVDLPYSQGRRRDREGGRR
jgi:hypothetical protein